MNNELTVNWSELNMYYFQLRALSHALKCCIEVIQAAGPPVVLGGEYPPPALMLTYHRHMYNLGEHYNSVTDYASDEEAQWNGEADAS